MSTRPDAFILSSAKETRPEPSHRPPAPAIPPRLSRNASPIKAGEEGGKISKDIWSAKPDKYAAQVPFNLNFLWITHFPTTRDHCFSVFLLSMAVIIHMYNRSTRVSSALLIPKRGKPASLRLSYFASAKWLKTFWRHQNRSI